MSTFITSYSQYEKVCKMMGTIPTIQKFQEVMTLTNEIIDLSEEEKYVQVDYNDRFKEYIKNHPDVTLDDFLDSMKPQEKQDSK